MASHELGDADTLDSGGVAGTPRLADADTLDSGDAGPPRPRLVDADTLDSGPLRPPRRIGDVETLDSGGEPWAQGAFESTARGVHVGRYVILARLGEGAMGEVFAGFDRELERRVALKLLRRHVADDAIGRARMQREAQALARLSHPNVVQVHDAGEVGGRLFVAMEYVKGETLAVWQRRHDPRTPAGRREILGAYVQAGRGLAAAHAAGIIHRDFKPSNVLVGDDGRTRVLDFGLAAPRGEEPPASAADSATALAHDGRLRPDLTRTGSVLGTPAYMAPEQFLARATDHRTDVFAFSVALYEALHGVGPFDGDTFADRRTSVLVGDLRPPPPGSGVPAWLRQVLLTGLALDPQQRHASMDALLAALADDPVERRRRRVRVTVLGLAALGLAAALIAGAQWARQRWQHAADEARADDRLAAVEARVADDLAAGRVAEAEQAFAAFVEHPDNRGRAAVGRAWLHRADRARERGEAAAALDALASALVAATTAVDQAAARLELARVFRDELRWPGLQLALATLGEDPPGVDRVELDRLHLDAALARRDLAGAAALLRGPLADSPRAALLPALAALQPATRTVHRHRGGAVIADLDGDGRVEIVLETDARDRKIAPLLRAEPTLPQIDTLDLESAGFHALSPGPGEPALLVTNERHSAIGIARDSVLRRWHPGHLAEVHRWPEDRVISALSADVDGDGVRDLFVGTGPYSRHVSRLSRGTDGAWLAREASPELARRRSDVVDLLADDLDGDGTIEVVAALGPWSAYELVVLRHDPASGELRPFTRHRLGNISGAALVRRGPPGAPPEIAVSKTDEYPSPHLFPPERPLGEPAGVHLLRLQAGALVETAFAPAPTLTAATLRHTRPLVGDLDGDGRDELVVGASVEASDGRDHRDATVVFVRDADGALVPALLGDLRPIAVLDLDGDGDAELVASDSADAETDRVWVLGSGQDAPPVHVASAPPPLTDLPDDPVLARTWLHADELARMGLVRQAADNLVATADQIAEPALRAQAALRAAELLRELRDDPGAAPLFIEAAGHPSRASRAHAGAARALLYRGRLAAAAEHLAAALAAAGHIVADATPSPSPVAAAAEHLAAAGHIVADATPTPSPVAAAGQLAAAARPPADATPTPSPVAAAGQLAAAARPPADATPSPSPVAAAGQLAAAARPPAELVADATAPVAAALAALQAAPGVHLDFTRPLPDDWRISQPLALRRDGALARLRVDAIVPGELLAAPVAWTGGALVLEVELELDRVDWRSGLFIGLVRDGGGRDGGGLDDGGSPLGLDITTTGGGAERTRELACTSYGRRIVARTAYRVREPPPDGGRTTLRATLLPELGEWTCEVESAAGAPFYERNQSPSEAREAGSLRLAIASSHGPLAWASARVARVALLGAELARPATTADDPAALAGRAIVEDDPLAALAALAALTRPLAPNEALLRVAALTRLGRLDEAEQALVPVFDHREYNLTLWAELRRDPAVFGALIRDARSPAIARDWLAVALYAVVAEHDPRAVAAAWAGLAERDLAADGYHVLRVHAAAATDLGHIAAARASHRAALAALAAGDRPPGTTAATVAAESLTGRVELAALALAAGDEQAARDELRPYVSGPGADPQYIDRVLARDDLRPLRDLVAE